MARLTELERVPEEFVEFCIEGKTLCVPGRYTIKRVLGDGAYGLVCEGQDSTTNMPVAIKKVSGIFEDATDMKRTLREVKFMQFLQHENVMSGISFLGVFHLYCYYSDFIHRQAGTEIYLVTHLMETDLLMIIQSSQTLGEDQIRYFMYQLLRGLKFIHSARIIHRDIKPSNLLINSNCDLKICDFGLARIANQQNSKRDKLTEYVVTRWYRAPEVMLCSQSYNCAVDIWSAGVIFAELYTRNILLPGENYVDQVVSLALVKLLLEWCGLHCRSIAEACIPVEFPPELQFITNKKALAFVDSLPDSAPLLLADVCGDDLSTMAACLMGAMLTLQPQQRVSAAESLTCPWFESLHDEDDEPDCEHVFDFKYEAEFQKYPKGLQLDKYRSALVEQVTSFKVRKSGS